MIFVVIGSACQLLKAISCSEIFFFTQIATLPNRCGNQLEIRMSPKVNLERNESACIFNVPNAIPLSTLLRPSQPALLVIHAETNSIWRIRGIIGSLIWAVAMITIPR